MKIDGSNRRLAYIVQKSMLSIPNKDLLFPTKSFSTALAISKFGQLLIRSKICSLIYISLL